MLIGMGAVITHVSIPYMRIYYTTYQQNIPDIFTSAIYLPRILLNLPHKFLYFYRFVYFYGQLISEL